MKIYRKYALQFVCLFIFLTVCVYGRMLPVAVCQQADKPISKAALIRSFKPGRRERIAAVSYIELIDRYGVDFSLTPEDEKEIRGAGKYLGRKGLEELVAAIRNNYRPNASEASSARKDGEPTEEEMNEALLRTMQKRGGQLRADGCVGVDNSIAGMCVKIENFEKLGCKPASQGVGYICTYNITTSVSVHSNEGSEPGDRQAKAWNDFLIWLGGKNVNETLNRRFVRSKEGWIMSNE